MRRVLNLLVLIALVGVGCGANVRESASNARSAAGRDEAAGEAKDSPRPRKIQYTHNLEVLVEDFASAQGHLEKLISEEEQNGGYVSRKDVSSYPNAPRYGNWTVRIPVERVDNFLSAAANLGEPRRQSTNAKDVTTEFYDVEERIRGMTIDLEGLKKLYQASEGRLRDPNAKMEDHLKIRAEYERTQRELEALKGRMVVLRELTDLAEVHISLSDRKSYVPATAPDFNTNISRTWSNSIDALIQFGKALVLGIVALIPWIPVLLIGLLVLRWLLRGLYCWALGNVLPRSAQVHEIVDITPEFQAERQDANPPTKEGEPKVEPPR
jgi:hypothetical protein